MLKEKPLKKLYDNDLLLHFVVFDFVVHCDMDNLKLLQKKTLIKLMIINLLTF